MNRADLRAKAAELQATGITCLVNPSPSDRSYIAAQVGHGTYRSFTLPGNRLVFITVQRIEELLAQHDAP